MTIAEVCQELRAHSAMRGKVYAGIMDHATFFVMLGRIERNEGVKLCTITSFFNRLGYYGSFNEWRKRETIVLEQSPTHSTHPAFIAR